MGRFLRWLFVVVTAVAVLGGGAAAYYLNYSPDRSTYPLRGIDVSHHQGAIDWSRVARSDVAFAILKATEGGDHVDDTFARNLDGARAAGLAVGAYHFFTFCRPGAEQAANFLQAVPRDKPLLPPIVDIEFPGNCAARPSVADLQRELTAFLAPVEAAFGRPAVVYMLDDAAQQYGAAVPERQRWVRSLVWPPGGGDWLLWQYHNAGHVDGIGGEVDLNVLRGGPAMLNQMRAPVSPT
jgi:lysozyme